MGRDGMRLVDKLENGMREHVFDMHGYGHLGRLSLPMGRGAYSPYMPSYCQRDHEHDGLVTALGSSTQVALTCQSMKLCLSLWQYNT